MTVRKPFLSALVACFGLALFVASCAKPSGAGNTCGSGQTDCNGSCINVMSSDANNCGACGKSCGNGGMCTNGACGCSGSLLFCNNACVQQDNTNCGQCGHGCTGTQVCSGGQCTTMCKSTEMQCSSGSCVDVTSNPLACGSCTNKCGTGANCVNSTCACTVSGQMLCN